MAGFKSPMYWVVLFGAMCATALAAYGVAMLATEAPDAVKIENPGRSEAIDDSRLGNGPKPYDTIQPYKTEASGE